MTYISKLKAQASWEDGTVLKGWVCERSKFFKKNKYSKIGIADTLSVSFDFEVSFRAPGWLSRLSIWLLVSAQVMNSGPCDQALRRAPYSAGNLFLPLPFPLPADYAFFLTVSQINT